MLNLSGIGIDFGASEMLIQSNELIRRSINIFLYLEKENKNKNNGIFNEYLKKRGRKNIPSRERDRDQCLSDPIGFNGRRKSKT